MKTLLVAGLLLGANGAFAKTECTVEPESKWMTVEAFKAKAVADGYTIKKFKKTAGNCYEIYGTDKEGKKVEIYFNPVDASIVKSK